VEEIFARFQRMLMRSGVVAEDSHGVVLVGGNSLLDGRGQELADAIVGSGPPRDLRSIDPAACPRRIDDRLFTHRRGALLSQSNRARGVGTMVCDHWSRAFGKLRSRLSAKGEGFLVCLAKRKINWAKFCPEVVEEESVMIEVGESSRPGRQGTG